MDLSKIFAIPGKGGLFKLISHSKSNAIMESLSDKKRLPIFNISQTSCMEEIAIYTDEKEEPLMNVFRTIYTKLEGKSYDTPKDDKDLLVFFEEILPNYDKERVYVSNLKKLFSWYNVLIENSLIDMDLSPREIEIEKYKAEMEAQDKNADEETEKKSAPAKVAANKPAATRKPKAKAEHSAPPPTSAPAQRPKIQRKSSV